jgi:anaerobic nitric oxide reductase flavorubredoxin
MVSELKNGIWWVGIVDWGLKHFHGFELSTHRGSTYNSYLIADEKIALVDTVWSRFTSEFIENVREVVDPAKIDYVIAQHAESDHSGSLPAIMDLCPKATLVVSPRGQASISGHYHKPWKFHVVKTGDKISLGSCELVFIEAPMLHWPDSMFTYVSGKGVLMPNDAFGQHYATCLRFNDQVDQKELYEEALKYYANILTPFSDMVLKKIDEVLALDLPVDMICPSHGVIWRKDPLQIVRAYQDWARQTPQDRAVVLFDTMWNGTRRMAEAIGDGLQREGVPYVLCHMGNSDRNDVVTKIFEAKAVVVGSPTVNRGPLPTLMPILEELRGLRFKNKIGAAFASYGWSGESLSIIEKRLEESGVTLVSKGVKALWAPSMEELAKCTELGREVGKAVKARP